MYRSSLEGLTEQIRTLEEQKRHLEADIVGLGRMRRPQRLLGVAIAALLLLGAGWCGRALGYRQAVVQLGEASRQDARTALRRIELCNERLREVVEVESKEELAAREKWERERAENF
jgi:hypothetical protein